MDLTLEQNLTLEPKLTFETKVDIPELIPITLEPKSTIPPSRILLLDIGIDHNDSLMVFQDRSCKGNNFHDRIFHDPIHIKNCKYVNRKKVNKGGFREPPHYLDWIATLGPIRPPPEPPP